MPLPAPKEIIVGSNSKLYVGNCLVKEISRTFSTLPTKGKIYFLKSK